MNFHNFLIFLMSISNQIRNNKKFIAKNDRILNQSLCILSCIKVLVEATTHSNNATNIPGICIFSNIRQNKKVNKKSTPINNIKLFSIIIIFNFKINILYIFIYFFYVAFSFCVFIYTNILSIIKFYMKNLFVDVSAFLKHSWWVLLLLVFLRLTFLTHHPVVNDEALYVEYMQQQHDDFEKYKWISIDNQHKDWKPPLQYWMGSNFVNMFENPMAWPRFMHGLISVIWYFFLLLLLFRVTGSALFVNITGLLFAFSPTFGNLDKLVLTDSIVYGFWYVLLWVIYELLKLFLKKGRWLWKILWILVVLVLFWALMFTKQTGEVFVIYPAILIILVVYQHFGCKTYFKRLKSWKVWKTGLLLWFWYGIVLIISRFFYKLSIPEHLYSGKDAFTQHTGYAFGIREILTQWPIDVWIDNLIQWFKHDYVIVYGVPTMFAMVLSLLLFFIIKKKNKKKENKEYDRDVIWLVFLWICWMMVAGTYIILVKKFSVQWNKFMLYTWIVNLIAWWYILSNVFNAIFDKFFVDLSYKCTIKKMMLACLGLGLIIPHWIWNMSYYTILPHNITEVIGTYTGHCIKFGTCNRGLHAQTDELINYLVNRDKEGIGSVVFVDPTRWIPGTVIKIHQRLFPNQNVIWLIETGMLVDFDSFLDSVRVKYPNQEILFMFDGLASRDWWVYEDPLWLKKFAESDLCENKFVRHKLNMPATNFTLCLYK